MCRRHLSAGLACQASLVAGIFLTEVAGSDRLRQTLEKEVDGLNKLLEFADVEEVAIKRAGQVVWGGELEEELEGRVRRCCN